MTPAIRKPRRFHGVIQKSMGWTNSHLHKFKIDGRELGRPDPDGLASAPRARASPASPPSLMRWN